MRSVHWGKRNYQILFAERTITRLATVGFEKVDQTACSLFDLAAMQVVAVGYAFRRDDDLENSLEARRIALGRAVERAWPDDKKALTRFTREFDNAICRAKPTPPAAPKPQPKPKEQKDRYFVHAGDASAMTSRSFESEPTGAVLMHSRRMDLPRQSAGQSAARSVKPSSLSASVCGSK